MEKIATVELNSNNIKMSFAYVNNNKSFVIYNEIDNPINLTKDFESDFFIKPTPIKEILAILKVYKEMINKEEITEVFCVATSLILEAKNHNSFINEIYNSCGLKFKVIEPEEEINSYYTAIINTFNKPKTLIINIEDYNTQFMLYNRRNVLNTLVIPYGYENLTNKFIDADNDPIKRCELMQKFFSEQLIKDYNWLYDLQEEFEVVGCGDVFLSLGAVSRKAKRYPLDIAHNYEMNKADISKVYDAIKLTDTTKSTKIKGISKASSKYLPAGLCIINALFNKINRDDLSISKSGVREGLLLNYTIPLTLEKPISDTLGFSLQVINDFYEKNPEHILHIYELSMILFKQLKVLHKLGRSYIKILRIASYLYNCGTRINFYNREKNAFYVVQNSEIYGVTHREIVLASFVASIREIDNFSVADWVRFKDLVTDEDLVAIKKLSVILKLAESLDITGFGSVEDISCDVLGDSVIMKTIVNKDASLELKYSMLIGNEFKKAFNKNLELL